MVSSMAAAQNFDYNRGGATTSHYYEEIPYEDVNGLLVIHVTVGGKSRRFIFDTGAPVMLSDSLASELKLKEIQADSVTDINYHKFLMSIASIDIKIGKTTFAGVPAIKGFKGDIMKCWNPDGIIGSNLVRHSIVSFNKVGHVIIITDDINKLKLSAQNKGKLGTNSDTQSSPILNIGVNNAVDMQIEFDSGDSGFLRITDDIAQPLLQRKLCEVLDKGYGAGGMGMGGLQGNAQKLKLLFTPFKIGDETFKQAICSTSITGIPGMGNQLLNYGTLTLDYLHGDYYFDPLKPEVELDKKSWPVDFWVKDGNLIAAVVWDKLAAQIKPEEQIVAIDGTKYGNLSFCDMINNTFLDGKETTVFTVKDAAGKLRQVTIKYE